MRVHGRVVRRRGPRAGVAGTRPSSTPCASPGTAASGCSSGVCARIDSRRRPDAGQGHVRGQGQRAAVDGVLPPDLSRMAARHPDITADAYVDAAALRLKERCGVRRPSPRTCSATSSRSGRRPDGSAWGWRCPRTSATPTPCFSRATARPPTSQAAVWRIRTVMFLSALAMLDCQGSAHGRRVPPCRDRAHRCRGARVC